MGIMVKIEIWIWSIMILPTIYVGTIFYSTTSLLSNITVFLWVLILVYYAFFAPWLSRPKAIRIISFFCFPIAFLSAYGAALGFVTKIDQSIISLPIEKSSKKFLLFYFVPFLNSLIASAIFVPAIVKISGNQWLIYTVVASSAALLIAGEYILSIISFVAFLLCSIVYTVKMLKKNPNKLLKSQALPAGTPQSGAP